MNIYSTEFFSICPVNGVRVKYDWRIETDKTIPVEQMLAATETADGFHEEIADHLAAQFQGAHTLRAFHHGVNIETIRGSPRVVDGGET